MTKTFEDLAGEELFRVDEVAHKVGIATSTVWKWARQGKLPSPIKISHKVTVWRKSELLPAIERLLAQ